jgi:hypothetical protein
MAEVRLNIAVTNQGGAVIASVQESLSSLGKTSDTVLTKMSGFSTEALQKLSYAGVMVGVSAEEISTGMLKLQKNLMSLSRSSQ